MNRETESAMSDLVKLARSRVDEPRTHWEGCERDHRECLIQRMADEIERLTAEALDRASRLCIEEGRAKHFESECIKLRAEIKENDSVVSVWRGRTQRAEAERDALRAAMSRCLLGDPPGDCYAAKVVELRALLRKIQVDIQDQDFDAQAMYDEIDAALGKEKP